MKSEFSEPEGDSQEEIQETREAGCTPKLVTVLNQSQKVACVLLLLLCMIVTLMFLKMPKSSIFLHLSEIVESGKSSGICVGISRKFRVKF